MVDVLAVGCWPLATGCWSQRFKSSNDCIRICMTHRSQIQRTDKARQQKRIKKQNNTRDKANINTTLKQTKNQKKPKQHSSSKHKANIRHQTKTPRVCHADTSMTVAAVLLRSDSFGPSPSEGCAFTTAHVVGPAPLYTFKLLQATTVGPWALEV